MKTTKNFSSSELRKRQEQDRKIDILIDAITIALSIIMTILTMLVINGDTMLVKLEYVSAAEKVELSKEQKAYVDKWYQLCIDESIDHNLPWQVPMAQGILEGGCGTTENAVKNHNHHGIISVNGGYRHFDTDEEGWRGYFDNIEVTKVYAQNGIYETFDDPEACMDSLVAAGYAEDPNYLEKLSKLVCAIEIYRLEKGWPTSAEYADQIETDAQAAWEQKVAEELAIKQALEQQERFQQTCHQIFDDAITKDGQQFGRVGGAAIISGFIAVYRYCYCTTDQGVV